MTATYTANSRLTKQGDNDNPNSWGDVLNEQCLDLIDELVCGVANVDITGTSNVNLATGVANGSTDQARHAVLELTGTLGANIDLILPALEKTYIIKANYSGAFTVTVKPSGGGSGLAFSNTTVALVYTNGTNITKVADVTPAAAQTVTSGMMLDWGGTIASVPAGWLFCDGSAVSRTTYADLFAAIGTVHGAGNGTTTFNIPDTRNVVVVGAQQDDSGIPKTNITGSLTTDGGAIAVTLTTSNIPAHTHTFSGSGSTSSAGGHSHTIPTSGLGSSTAHVAGSVPTGGVSGSVGSGGSGSTSSVGDHTHTFSISGDTGSIGSGTSFNVVPPYTTLPKIIKT